jgi:hypothetical protein
VRTVTIVTSSFRPLAVAQARTRGRADLAMIVVSHPIGGLRPIELAKRIDDVVNQLASGSNP